MTDPNSLTSSATIYFSSDDHSSVPIEWYQRALQFFGELDVSPVLFTAGGGVFEVDDCYVLDDFKTTIRLFGEILIGRQRELEYDLEAGNVKSLMLDCPEQDATDRDEWRVMSDLSCHNGSLFMGATTSLVNDLARLMLRAHSTLVDLITPAYGYAFQMEHASHPDLYVNGSSRVLLADWRKAIRDRSAFQSRVETTDEMWSAELRWRKRYLQGLFRDAYPVNLLSASHMESGDICASGIGTVVPLAQVWMWHLDDSELEAARGWLADRNVLVCQQYD